MNIAPKKRILLISSGVVFAVFLFGEIALRTFFGFCDAVLIREDPHYEYIAQPDQRRVRFGNKIYYNKESMRSNEIDNTAVKILFFGDSVINGGTLTDQDSLATTILSETLTKFYKKNIQVLNISAGSWGPDNCYAYLQQHGDFQGKHLFLFVSSHDAYDNMNFEKIVGVNESFPDKQFKLAWMELVERYLLPRMGFGQSWSSNETDYLGISKKTKESKFNSGFASFASYSQMHNIPLTIYLHADKRELKTRSYNEQGQEIIRFCEVNDIPLIKDLENGLDSTDYRDDIHLNNKGQKKISEILFNYIITSRKTWM